MIRKTIFAVISCLVLLCVYVIFVINEDKNLIKFATSYCFLKKSNFVISDELNPCSFSEMTLKNNVKLTCEPLKNICNNKIPIAANQINKDTACSIITFDVNDSKKVQSKFQVLSYNDGISTIPNSIEYKILFDKHKSFRGKIKTILLFYEVRNFLK